MKGTLFINSIILDEGEEHGHYGRNKYYITKDVDASEMPFLELVTFIVKAEKEEKENKSRCSIYIMSIFIDENPPHSPFLSINRATTPRISYRRLNTLLTYANSSSVVIDVRKYAFDTQT